MSAVGSCASVADYICGVDADRIEGIGSVA
jgi:hypothetical protein